MGPWLATTSQVPPLSAVSMVRPPTSIIRALLPTRPPGDAVRKGRTCATLARAPDRPSRTYVEAGREGADRQ